jgi:DNA invertase Pin-like site-specific DNA recombinase
LEFIDVDTAKQAGRGGFGEMLRFLKSDPTCRTILVEKTDRLYRNIKDWTTIDDLDVTIHFVIEKYASGLSMFSDDLRSIDALPARSWA